MSNGLDPEQAQCFDRPDLDPNCLPRLSAEDNSRQRADQLLIYQKFPLQSKFVSYLSVYVDPDQS